MSDGMTEMNRSKVPQHLGELGREMAAAMADYPSPKTKDDCILSAFKEMSGKTITRRDLELLRCLLLHGATR